MRRPDERGKLCRCSRPTPGARLTSAVVGHNELEAAEARDLGLASVREAGSLEGLEAAARAIGEEALAVG